MCKEPDVLDSGRSRSSDKGEGEGGGGHQDHEIRGRGPVSKKSFFSPSGLSLV